ncbi:MAG: septum formation initiator family protein [Thermoleophilia bacterium]|nr:septum formation initiator family protein [Thermoleophilia bacterium]
MLTAVCIGYIGPVNGYISQRSELARERADLTRLEARRDALSAQLKALERADVLEARARQLGLLMPGEKGYVLKRAELEPPAPAPERHDDGLWGWLTSRF